MDILIYRYRFLDTDISDNFVDLFLLVLSGLECFHNRNNLDIRSIWGGNANLIFSWIYLALLVVNILFDCVFPSLCVEKFFFPLANIFRVKKETEEFSITCSRLSTNRTNTLRKCNMFNYLKRMR
jgi:hypothetical protein